MPELICNAPFCENTRNINHAWCSAHRWEREKYKIKVYKEVLPYWYIKRCDKHGLLKKYQVYINPANNSKICIKCRLLIPYDPIKQKKINQKRYANRKNNRLSQRYGINSKHYEKLLLSQNNKCAICLIHIEELNNKVTNKRDFHLDHCHETGKIRGLLCFHCNVGLGYFKDSLLSLSNAISYLRPHKEP